MLIVGLTGGISSGKSTVASLFKERGIVVLDSDEIVKELQKPNSELLLQISETFGPHLIDQAGNLNRKALGNLIFHDEEAKEKLNQLIHPRVKEKLEEGIRYAKQNDEELIILDIPLLYESQFDSLVDLTIVVYVPKGIQITRLMQRDEIDENYALSKIKSQLSLEEKKEKADLIIDNSGTFEQLKLRFEEILNELKKH